MANLIPKVVADFETSLASAISIGATSFTLSSATDDDGNSLPAGKYCFTLNNGSSNKQYLLGQLNGTAVTSVVSVNRQGTETSGAAYAARAGSPIIISDFATIQRVADILKGVLELDGSNPLVYDAEPTLADRKELATVGYVLDNIAGGTVTFDEQVIAATAGESIVAGNLSYFNTADQEWYKTDADTAATVDGVQLGIALGSGSDGVSISGGVQISGTWTTTGLTAGSLYYASNTAGAITTSAGTTSRPIGIALSTTRLLIIPRTPIDLTSGQLAALAGTPGTPSSSNKFVTQNKSMVAGATINGATLPVPVYQNTSDNEFYACDGNDTAALKYAGFATSNGVDGGALNVQFSGVVGGFSGLDEGPYYLSDTAGTIQNTPGTYPVLVGVAISSTELLIQKGRRYANGGSTSLGTASGSSAVTCGFRPSVIRIFAVGASSAHIASMQAVWVNGTIVGIAGLYNEGTTSTANDGAILYSVDGSANMTFTIGSVTATGFTITWTETGTFADAARFIWEAEGDF